MLPIIEVRNLSKKYRLGTSAYHFDRLSDRLAQETRKVWSKLKGNSPKENPARNWFWGLRDVSLDVHVGEVVGIIGSNGAGKSTLLKILSRITEPTSGYGKLRGRSASLLEVGTGFHPDLTGRENIYLNGSILGMSKAEVRASFDEIVAFSEIGRFLDTPVKRYSSGMYVRLAFAVAAHLQPEILIVDEVLAVGDMAFQKKCLGKMTEVGKSGRTVLFVSHNMAALQNLCERGIVLRKGRLAFDGNVKEAVDHYVQTVYGDRKEPRSQTVDLSNHPRRPAEFTPKLKSLEVHTGDGLPLAGGVSYGGPVSIRVSCQFNEPARNPNLLLWFINLLGDAVFVADSGFDPVCVVDELVGEHVFICEIPSLSLIPGEYTIHPVLWARGSPIDRVEDAIRLTVLPADYYGTGKVPKFGRCVLPHRWQLKDDCKVLAEVGDLTGSVASFDGPGSASEPRH
jgi:lipopolysaccharide transport system ATP-binding protein